RVRATVPGPDGTAGVRHASIEQGRFLRGPPSHYLLLNSRRPMTARRRFDFPRSGSPIGRDRSLKNCRSAGSNPARSTSHFAARQEFDLPGRLQWGISDNGSTSVLHSSSGGSTPPFSTTSTPAGAAGFMTTTVPGPDGTAGVSHAS